MNWIDTFFGHGTDLSVLQMSCRAIITFFVALILLRIAGIRTFGKKTPFDNVIIILLGSVLSRAVVGASPYIATVVACFVFVIIHWVLAKLSFYYDFIGLLIKGKKHCLYKDGEEMSKNMRRANISKKDLHEDLRLKIHADDFKNVKEINIERNGEVSIIYQTPEAGK